MYEVTSFTRDKDGWDTVLDSIQAEKEMAYFQAGRMYERHKDIPDFYGVVIHGEPSKRDRSRKELSCFSKKHMMTEMAV